MSKKIETKNTALAIETKKPNTTNSTKFDKVLSMNEIIELSHKNNVQFYATNNTSTQYRIFNGKSSINIKKSMYVLYATTTDFENIENAKLNNVKCERDKNIIDGKRPHKVTIQPNAIENVIKVLALNTANHAQ